MEMFNNNIAAHCDEAMPNTDVGSVVASEQTCQIGELPCYRAWIPNKLFWRKFSTPEVNL